MWMYYLKLIGNALINCKLQHPPHCNPPPPSLQHLSFWGLVTLNFHLSLEQNWVQILFPSAGVASQKPYSEKNVWIGRKKGMVYGLSSKLSRSMTLQLPPILMGFWKCESKLIFFISSLKCRFQTSVKPEITIRIIVTCFLSFFYGLDLSYYLFRCI